MSESVVIAEIAGRDSIAAAVLAVRERGFTHVIPTIALTGTETGDFDQPLRAADTLRRLLDGHAEVFSPTTLMHPELWQAMNATFADELQQRYGMHSPCLACHLFLHLLRVPAAWLKDNAPVVAGERDTHDGRIKLSQTAAGMDAATRVLAYADVELLQPVRALGGAEIAEIVGDGWAQGAEQLGCVHTGNYVNEDGTVTYDEAAYARYLAEFYEPVGRAIIDSWRAEKAGEQPVDAHTIVRRVLDGV